MLLAVGSFVVKVTEVTSSSHSFLSQLFYRAFYHYCFEQTSHFIGSRLPLQRFTSAFGGALLYLQGRFHLNSEVWSAEATCVQLYVSLAPQNP
jgi:hypothetical protein